MRPTAVAAAPHSTSWSETGRLDSWKEIAAYLRRGARTVQRWEREEGLPVHRLHHDKLSSVYAYAHELDSWFAARVAPSAAAPAVAVLPFTDMSPDSGLRYLCDGVAEEIALALGRVEGLRTLAVGAAAPPRGVDWILTGSARGSGNRLRVAVRLVDAGNTLQLWCRSFDRGLEDVLDWEWEIAERVREALEERIERHEEAGPSGPVPVVSGQRVARTSRPPSAREYSRGTRDGMTA
jgi:TolB-like protein